MSDKQDERIAVLEQVVRNLIEVGDGIRCYPSGAVGFDEWHEAMEAAQLVLGQFMKLEWEPWRGGGFRWLPIEGPSQDER